MENSIDNGKRRRNDNLMQVRLKPHELEEKKRLNMGDREYLDYLHNKQKESKQNLTPKLSFDKPLPEMPKPPVAKAEAVRTNNTPGNMEEIIKERERAHAAELQAKEAQMRLEYMQKQLEDMNAKSLNGLESINSILDQKIAEREKEKEFRRLQESERELSAEVDSLTEELNRAKDDLLELAKKVEMKEIIQENLPHLGRLIQGYQEGGTKGLISALNGLGDPEGTKSIAVETIDEETKDKIRFATSVKEKFKAEDLPVIVEMLGKLAVFPHLIREVNDSINESIKNSNTTKSSEDTETIFNPNPTEQNESNDTAGY